MSEKVEIGYVDVCVRLRVVAPAGWRQNLESWDADDQSPDVLYREVTSDAVATFEKRMGSVSARVPGSQASVQVCKVEKIAQHEVEDLPSEDASFDPEQW